MFTEKLRGRFGAAPLFTHYDGTAGSRVELSGTTFSNWVDSGAAPNRPRSFSVNMARC